MLQYPVHCSKYLLDFLSTGWFIPTPVFSSLLLSFHFVLTGSLPFKMQILLVTRTVMVISMEYHQKDFFKNAGDTTSTKSSVTEESSDIISVVMGAILLISSLFGTVLIDRFGRRRLLLIGLFGSALSNAVVVAFPSSPFLVTTGFSLTKAFIGLGAGAPAWFLTSELVSAAHVSLFQSLSTGFLLISTMLVTFFYLQLNFVIGNYSIFILSSGPAFILAIILYFFLPETKGKTTTEVSEIENKIKDGSISFDEQNPFGFSFKEK
uniref:MFS domain-containing protein n=1 Tax=Heterorhabditis bacteriophora TaxID=37862 RepID=A0A1I7X6X5_HETBA